MLKSYRQIFVILAIVVTAGAIIYVAQEIITDHLNSARDENGRPVSFVIQRNETIDSIADRLNDDELIRSAAYFRFRVRFSGADQEIVAGQHELNTGMSTSQIIDTITSQDDVFAAQTTVTFLEGWRVEQFGDALVEAGLIDSVDEFVEAASEAHWTAEFSSLHSRPSGVGLEGYLFPDTYSFRDDATVDDIIHTLLSTFEERVTAETRASAESLGLTFHQAMTLASIVEREASEPEERPTIASVYYNRLLAGMPLQADPTVQYDLGEPGNWWPVLTPENVSDPGPYNTYFNPSLPPGPICSPGLDAIRAAFSPETTNYLYFVAKGDGTHAFAETLEEHEANIREYQNEQDAEATATPQP